MLHVVGEPAPLFVEASSPVAEMFTLSPYVWREDEAWRIALRLVPRSEDPAEKVSRVHLGRSDDGVRFVVDDAPVLPPGGRPGRRRPGRVRRPDVGVRRQPRVGLLQRLEPGVRGRAAPSGVDRW